MRLTLDLDNCTKSRAMRIYRFFTWQAESYLTQDVELWRSASRKGYHIVVWNMPADCVRVWRAIFDDARRLRLDSQFRKKPHQVLFTTKNGKKAKRIK